MDNGGVAVHLVDDNGKQVNNEASNVVHLSEEDLAQGRAQSRTSAEHEEFFRRTTKKGKLDAGRTVWSGYAYDFDLTDEMRPRDIERAERLREELGEEPLHGIEGRYVYRFIKRTFDIAFSIAIIVAFSWLYILIAILVKLDDSKGPVFFKQKRITKNGREFYMHKFRSMCVDAENKLAELKELNEKSGPVFKIADDLHITRVGKWIRKLSLASVIIGAPGAGELTNSLSLALNTSLDQQFYGRHPEAVSCDAIHKNSPKFLSFGIFGGLQKPQYETINQLDSDGQTNPCRYANGFISLQLGGACYPVSALGVAA